MGDLRQPEATKNQENTSSGVERASNILFDQLLQGDFNVRRNAPAMLAEACQLNALTLTDDKNETELSLRTNAYTLGTHMELRNPGYSAAFNFMAAEGWNNPFRRPTYSLEAQTTDRRTLLNLNSKDGAAPDVLFKHNSDNLNVNYVRNMECNQLTINADGGRGLPLQANFFHDFRSSATTFGLRSERPDRATQFSLSAKDGVTPTFQFAHMQDGLSINYLRNPQSHQLRISAESGVRVPIGIEMGHNFRINSSSLGIRGQLSPQTHFGVGASIGPANYYDASFYVNIGGK